MEESAGRLYLVILKNVCLQWIWTMDICTLDICIYGHLTLKIFDPLDI